MRVAFATCSVFPGGNGDDHDAARRLNARFEVWDDPGVDWQSYDRVIVRSTWDYSMRAGEFLAWCAAIGPERLRNSPELIAWNADKRYLAALASPVVPTVFVAPGDPLPALEDEVVVKPSVSAGARSTGRFPAEHHDAARRLIESILRSGRTALVQPYQASVDERGETSLVFLGGEFSHALRKRQVLDGQGIAPTIPDGLRVARAMLREDLVVPSVADAAERALAERVMAELTSAHGTPVYARIDVVFGDDGEVRLLELEAVEPHLHQALAPGAAERFAAAIARS